MTDDPDNVVDITPKKRKATGAFAKGSPHNKPPIKFGSQGTGYGGPAKGKGSDFPVGPRPEVMTRGPVSADMIARKAARLAIEATRVEEFHDKIYAIATDPTVSPETQLNAAYKGIVLAEGNPVQRSISATLDDLRKMGEDDLRAEHDRITRAIASSGA